MNRLPAAAFIPFSLAMFALIAAIWLGLAPAPKPSWASDPNAGHDLRMILCVAPLLFFALVLGAVGGFVARRRQP